MTKRQLMAKKIMDLYTEYEGLIPDTDLARELYASGLNTGDVYKKRMDIAKRMEFLSRSLLMSEIDYGTDELAVSIKDYEKKIADFNGQESGLKLKKMNDKLALLKEINELK